MRIKYNLFIFDLDGTLLDTSVGIIESIKYTLKSENLHSLSIDKMKTFIGPPIQKSLQDTYNLSEEESQRIANVFRDRYSNYDLLKADIYSGIFDLLRNLKENGVKLAVATYKREDYAIKMLEYFGLSSFMDVICGSDAAGNLSKLDIINKCIITTGVFEHNKIIVIGDTNADKLAASRLKVDFIGVNYGFGFQKVIGYLNKPIDLLKGDIYEN